MSMALLFSGCSGRVVSSAWGCQPGPHYREMMETVCLVLYVTYELFVRRMSHGHP